MGKRAGVGAKSSTSMRGSAPIYIPGTSSGQSPFPASFNMCLHHQGSTSPFTPYLYRSSGQLY